MHFGDHYLNYNPNCLHKSTNLRAHQFIAPYFFSGYLSVCNAKWIQRFFLFASKINSNVSNSAVYSKIFAKITKCPKFQNVNIKKKKSLTYICKHHFLFILEGVKNSKPIKNLIYMWINMKKQKKFLFILNLVPVVFKVGANVISIFNLASGL